MSQNEHEFDVVIFGSGPGGLQAAVHASRAKARVAVLGRSRKSALYKAHVENYCCMDTVLTGEEILEQGRRQAEKAGARLFDQDVLDLDRAEDGRYRVQIESGESLLAWAVILAMGISRNKLNVPGEKELLGKGVSYCVDCDANFFRNQAVAIIGNGSAAAAGALRLLLTASEVHLVGESLDVSDHLRYQVESSGVRVHAGRSVRAIAGESGVEAVELDNGETIPVSGVFIELGAKGAIELATRLDIALDPESMRFIVTSKKQETNVSGVYAAGDICGPPWQMAKAVGEGCVAGLEAALFAKRASVRQAKPAQAP